MESRSEHSPPEQEWNATYYGTKPVSRPHTTEPVVQDAGTHRSAAVTAVCARVREQLQALLESDGSVRPEAAAAIYGHLAVCPSCTAKYAAMQRVVNLLEAMPLAELPTDYSRLVMQRIQSRQAAPRDTTASQTAVGLCDRVHEKLQLLMDNDPSIRPEMAAALYGHLAVCADCAGRFSKLQRMVNLLETMPAAEVPMDFSVQVMRRIKAGNIAIAPGRERNAPGPTFAASSIVSEGVATHETGALRDSLSLESTGSAKLSVWQRLLITVGLTGLFVYLLASDWGRQMLGVNAEAATAWLSQIGEHLARVPVLGVLVVSLGAAMNSVNDALNSAFSTLGGMAAQALALEVSLGLAAVLLIAAKQRRVTTRF